MTKQTRLIRFVAIT